MSHLDQTLLFALKGYAWLPDLRRRANGRPIRTRLLGHRAVAIGGPEAARFFFAAGDFEPHPATVRLFGAGSVYTLDGPAHRHRKAMFVALLADDGAKRLVDQVGEEFDGAARRWPGRSEISLVDETARVLTAAVLRWIGVPETQLDPAPRRRERWLAKIIEDVRREPRPRSPLTSIALHSEDGHLLDSRTAAVELLNIIRPTIAVSRLVAFGGHALDRWPQSRDQLPDDEYARAFAHEVSRFYPGTPFLGRRATRDLRFQGEPIPAGTLVLLDVYGQHHDERVWPEPYAFRPDRFRGRPIGEFELIPQGGGDPRTGHRCPGEQLTVALLSTIAQRLAALDYYLPPQRTEIDLSRIPTRPRDGIRLAVSLPSRSPATRGT